MFRHGIADMRDIVEGDVRFTLPFGSGDLMRVPLSWLREYVDLPAGDDRRDVAEKLIRAGLEVETVEQLGGDLTGSARRRPGARHRGADRLKKPIRYCRVDVGDANGTGERAGDRLRRAQLRGRRPGRRGAARRRAARRLRDRRAQDLRPRLRRHDLLGARARHRRRPRRHHRAARRTFEPGADAIELLGPGRRGARHRGHPRPRLRLSMRGVAREAATAYGLPLRRPGAAGRARRPTPTATRSASPTRRAATASWPATVTGIDPAATSRRSGCSAGCR